MKRTLAALSLATVAALALSACGGGGNDPLSSGSTTTSGAGDSTSLVVGSADFSESVLLAELYAGALNAKGINATTKTNIGAREVYLKALDDGSIDLIPEYTGALALFYDQKFDKTDPDEVYTTLQSLLPDNLAVLDKSAAEDNDSINVTKETAEQLSLTTIEDLKGKEGDLTLAAPPEFKTRAQGVPGLKDTYGLTFKSFRPLKGQALVQALKNGQVDAANIFSTDPAIAVNGFVTLEDTKKLFGSQNVVPLIVKDKSNDEVGAALNAVSAALTTEKLADLLKQTDVDKKDPKTVAAEFLKANGLG